MAETPDIRSEVDAVLNAANLSTGEGRAKAARLACKVIAQHPDPRVRHQLLMDVAGPTRVREAILIEVVNDYVNA